MLDDGGISESDGRLIDAENRRDREDRLNRDLKEMYHELEKIRKTILKWMYQDTRGECLNWSKYNIT